MSLHAGACLCCPDPLSACLVQRCLAQRRLRFAGNCAGPLPVLPSLLAASVCLVCVPQPSTLVYRHTVILSGWFCGREGPTAASIAKTSFARPAPIPLDTTKCRSTLCHQRQQIVKKQPGVMPLRATSPAGTIRHLHRVHTGAIFDDSIRTCLAHTLGQANTVMPVFTPPAAALWLTHLPHLLPHPTSM